MDAKANTRSSVDSNSPLLNKSQDTPPSSSSSGKKKTSSKDAEAQKSDSKDALNPKHPISSIPFSMKHW